MTVEENMPEKPELSQSVGPVACVKCGTPEGLFQRRFEKTYTPKWVYLGLLFGVLPAGILMVLTNKTHHTNVRFCSSCWNRYRKAKMVSYALAIPCLLLFVAGPVLGLAYKSWVIAVAGITMAIIIAAIMDRYTRSASPKCVLLSRKSIVLAIPGHGDVNISQAKF
jgi:hypothetical protein